MKFPLVVLLVILPYVNFAQFQFPVELRFTKESNAFDCISNDDNFDVSLVLDSINNSSITDTTFLACCYHQIAAHYLNIGDDLEAIFYNRKAMNLRLQYNDEMLWKTYLNLGLSYAYLREYKTAVNFLTKASEEKSTFKKSDDYVKIINNLAGSYYELGELDIALDHLKKAITMDSDKENLIISYIYFSNIYNEKGDSINLNLAITYADSAQALSKATNDTEGFFISLNNKASAYNLMGKHNKAIKFYEQSLSNIDQDNSYKKATVLNNMATVFYDKKNHTDALVKLNESLELYKKALDNKFDYLYSGPYENIGDNYLSRGAYSKALENYQKAIINLTDNFKDTDIFDNPKLSDDLYVYSNIDLINVLHLKATAAFKFYRQNKKELFLDLAAQSYSILFDFHDQLQKDISTENSRLFQAKEIVPYLENALDVSYELYKKGENVSEAVFRIMEKNKSTVLLQSINEADALSYSNLPNSIVEKEKELKLFVTQYKRQLSEAQLYGDSLEIPKLQDRLFEEKEKYRQLIRKLENKFPEYYDLKYQSSKVELKMVQSNLEQNSALLEYFIGDKNIYIFTIQKERVDFHQIEKPQDWKQKINNFTDNLVYKHHDLKYTAQAYWFYQKLFEKPLSGLSENIKRLQIIPDAELNKIPFNILLTEPFRKDTVDFAVLPYTGNKFLISYAYSAKLIMEAQKEKKESANSNYAAFLANDPNNINKFCDDFVKNTSHILGGQIYKDEVCTKNNFKVNSNNFKVLNVIAHGKASEKNALDASLKFNDGLLNVADIYNISLSKTELVVLTACLAHVGPFNKGEGVMSLSRALTYSGCPGLVTTLWSIPTESTCIIMELFFKQLKAGKTIDEALWEAQKIYIEEYADCDINNISAHPYYWSGLVPFGNLNAIELDYRF